MLPRGRLDRVALAGVRSRRILAVCIDFVLVSLLVSAIWFASIVLTLGLALWLTGWRLHRFWIVLATTLVAGITGLASGPAPGAL